MSLTGHLLVASRKLRDPNFERTVVLLLEHNEEGALGVVLNRPTEKTVSEVWDRVGFEPCECDELLLQGGPVPGPLIALHQDETLAEKTVLRGLFLSMQKPNVDRLVRQDTAPFRLYSGNSGWGPDQLEGELKEGGWLTTEARLEDVFDQADLVWETVTDRIALDVLAPGIDPANLPDDPTLN